MFVCYINGEKNCTEKLVRHFPSTDEEIAPETKLILIQQLMVYQVLIQLLVWV